MIKIYEYVCPLIFIDYFLCQNRGLRYILMTFLSQPLGLYFYY